MKPCVKCEYISRIPMQIGPQAHQVGMTNVCLHPEMADPVEGTPLPCQVVRSNENFCGIKGKNWKQQAPKAPDSDKKVIQLQ